MENQHVKRHVHQRPDGRFQARYMSGVDANEKAQYRDVYGETREEVEAELESINRLYHFSDRETVKQIFQDCKSATTLDEALHILEMEFSLRGFTEGTIQRFLCAVRKFVTLIHKENDIQALTLWDVKNFILNQYNECGMSPSTCNGYSDSIRHLFELVLDRPIDPRFFPRFRKKKRLPEVLSKSEIIKLFDAIENPKYRMIASLMYSAGLRVSEAVRLRISDIRRNKMLIFVNQGKGGKDRFSILSERCLKELEDYWHKYHPQDYFFPSPFDAKKHVTTRTVEDAIKRAAKISGLTQRVTPHTLRRCFATHLIEANTGLFQTMEAMGHSSLKSMQYYLNLAGLPGVTSPYDI